MIEREAAAKRVEEITGLDQEEARRAVSRFMFAATLDTRHAEIKDGHYSEFLLIKHPPLNGPGGGGKSVKPSNLVFSWKKWKAAIGATMTVGGASAIFDVTVILIVVLYQLYNLATEDIQGEEAVLILTLDRVATRIGGIAISDLLAPLNEALERRGYPTTNAVGLERLIDRLEQIRVVKHDDGHVWLVEEIVAPLPGGV